MLQHWIQTGLSKYVGPDLYSVGFMASSRHGVQKQNKFKNSVLKHKVCLKRKQREYTL